MNYDMCGAGEVTQEKILLEFNFQNVKMPYESYKGDYASVKYFIKVIIVSTVKNTEYIKEFAVVNPYDSSILQKNDEPIKMQVGMKNKLSLAIYFQHKNYNCRGTLKGFIAFNYLNINLRFMEVQIVRREIIFGDKRCEPAYVARYELIDGVPNKYEKIPIRFFLKSYNLTPTYPNIDDIFFVKYYLNLVIADEDDNRYFKQKEICLFRLYKERRNVYNPNNQNENNYNYINEYGEFHDNDEIFITEPIYEEDFFMDNKIIQNEEEQQDNDINPNDTFYDDLKGMNQILPKNNNENDNYYDNNRNNNRKNRNNINFNNDENNISNSQDQKREEYKKDNYNMLISYMNNNLPNNIQNNENKDYDDFENMINKSKKNNKNNNNNNYNKNYNNINNNYNNNQNQKNIKNKNQIRSNNNKEKNEIIINNNPSNYHLIKTKNTKNSYDEDNMFEEDMYYENNNNINNNIINNNYTDDFKDNNNNINNENDINRKPIENKNEVHHSHRSNLMQARISSEDDFKDIFNSLDTNKNKDKDDLKKNIFG